MNNIRATFLALACLGLSIGTACIDQETIQKVGECAGPGIGDLFTTVQRLLLSDGSGPMSASVEAELLRLGEQHGPDVVKCLIERFIFEATAGPAASKDPAMLEAAGRGERFSARHP